MPTSPPSDVVEEASGSSDFYMARAQDALAMAEVETLSARRAVHLEAAHRWGMLADRMRRVERSASARILRDQDHPAASPKRGTAITAG